VLPGRNVLAYAAELPLKFIDAGIVSCRETGTDNDDSIVAGHVAEMREIALSAIKPLAHGTEGVSKTGLINPNLNGPHQHAPLACIRRERSSLSATGLWWTDDRPTLGGNYQSVCLLANLGGWSDAAGSAPALGLLGQRGDKRAVQHDRCRYGSGRSSCGLSFAV
jgi:hypothetical protein